MKELAKELVKELARNSILFLAAVTLFSQVGNASDSLYVGPVFGSTTYSTSVGGTTRQSQYSYGLENYYIHDHWAGGLSYQYFSPGQDGSQAINVTQSDHWLSVGGRYRIWNENFSPYISLGAGALVQYASTTVMGNVEQTNGVFFIQDFGVGIMGKIAGNFGANFSAKYYQFSNINGFDYFISVGFFPDL